MPNRPAGRERRAVPRRPCRAATCRLLGPAGHQPRWARLHDISPNGLALLLTARFDPGTILTVELRSAGRRGSYTLLARVVHTTPRPDGSWTTGCALVQRLPDDLLDELVEDPRPLAVGHT
jgi:hypothetical protein